MKSIIMIEAPSILGFGQPVWSSCPTPLSVPACSHVKLEDVASSLSLQLSTLNVQLSTFNQDAVARLES